MRRSSKPLPKDPNQLAAEIVRLSTEEPKQTQSVKEYLAAIGPKGGLKGGKARAQALPPVRERPLPEKQQRRVGRRSRYNQAGFGADLASYHAYRAANHKRDNFSLGLADALRRAASALAAMHQ